MKNKFLAFAFLFVSFFCHSEENPLQRLFFEATKFSATGFSHSYEAKILANAKIYGNELYLRRNFEYSSELKCFQSFYLCEKLNPERTGEIDLSFSHDDFENSLVDAVEQAFLMAEGESEIPDGQSILDILEKGDGRGIEENSVENAEDEKLLQEFIYTSKTDQIRRFSYDNEGMSIGSYGDEFFITRTYGKDIVRKIFDPSYRLKTIEKLSFSTDAKSLALKNRKDYFYDGDGTVVVRTVEEEPEKFTRKETDFYENGLPQKILTSHKEVLDEKEKKKKKSEEEKYLSDRLVNLAYDDERRIIENEETLWKYSKNTFGKAVTEKITTKYAYDFSKVTEGNKFPPDYDFFEDGQLRLSRKYSTVENYSEIMYFDEGFSISVEYENGVKKSEIVYIGEKEIRRRSFE